MKIRIIGCGDPMKWYADKIGQDVEYNGTVIGPGISGGTEYRCRDDGGYINFVAGNDAVELDDDEEFEILNTLPKTDRFDLEQQIMTCWNLIDDVDAVYHWIETLDLDPKSTDQIQNALLGIVSMGNIKFDNMFKTFEKMVNRGDIR